MRRGIRSPWPSTTSQYTPPNPEAGTPHPDDLLQKYGIGLFGAPR